MTYFTPGIDKYLAYWILSDTCFTPQDIEDNFYPFVMAINRNSQPLKDKTRSLDDPDIAELRPEEKQRILNKKTVRNPRTSDMSSFKEKVSLAIKRNHQDWNAQYIDDEVQKLAEKAIIILDALWSERQFPDRILSDRQNPVEIV